MRVQLAILITLSILIPYNSPLLADVYHFSDGSVRVGHRVSPKASPTIHLETLTGIEVLPSNAVKSVEDRASLCKAYQKLLSHLDPNSVRALTTLARWCREKGLYEEMFELYDQVEALDPDNREFKAFVYEMANSIQYKNFDARRSVDENEGNALLLRISKSPPTLKRIGEEIILSLPADETAGFLRKGLDHSLAPVRLDALRILAIQTPKAALEPIIAAALFDKKDEVRATAVDTLKKYEHDGIIYPFLRALKTNNRTYRMNALAALAEFNDLRSTGALIANLARQSSSPGSHRAHIYVGSQTSAVTGFDTEVAQSAAIADPIVSVIQDGVLLDVNVLGVSPGRLILKDERKMIARVLKDITGMNYGDDYLMWKQWWLNNREEIVN